MLYLKTILTAKKKINTVLQKPMVEKSIYMTNDINSFRKDKKMIIKHVRKVNGAPVATLVAEKTKKNEITVGWSLCNRKDNFNKHIGIDIATARLNRKNDTSSIPHLVRHNMGGFIGRAMKYFKVTDVKVVGKVD